MIDDIGFLFLEKKVLKNIVKFKWKSRVIFTRKETFSLKNLTCDLLHQSSFFEPGNEMYGH